MNDQLLALIRTAWQSVIASVIAYLLSLGIEIDSAALFAVTWPVVMAFYYLVATKLAERVPKLSLVAGPGKAPIYNDIPDDVLEKLLVP